jgi:hypothetical protein
MIKYETMLSLDLFLKQPMLSMLIVKNLLVFTRGGNRTQDHPYHSAP